MKYCFLVLFILFCCNIIPNDYILSLQQNKLSVVGTIKDSEGEPIIGATIKEVGVKNGVITNLDGKFSIEVANSNSELEISYLGFETQRVKASKVLDIIMKEATKSLEEVVVIGYGTVSKKDLTGSVSQLKTEEMKLAPVYSFDQALAGRVAGVQVSSIDGQPGIESNITIRGNNSLTQANTPLYVIDGVPMESPNNAALNPEEIASMTVLKDASSTAIYGSRGANGIIIIETKKGVREKPVITFGASIGFNQPQKFMKMMSPYEFVKYQIELNESNVSVYTPGDLDPSNPNYDPEGYRLESYKGIKGTDWQRLVIKNSFVQNYNLAIRGRSGGTQYSLSGSFFDQKGIIINTGSKRKQFRVNLTQRILPKVTLGVNANYSTNNRFGQVVNEGKGGSYTSYFLYRAWAARPVSGNPNVDLETMLEDPLALGAGVGDIRFNPYITSKNEEMNYDVTTMYANAYIDIDILKNLKFKSLASFVNSNTVFKTFYNSQTLQGTPKNPFNYKGVNGSFRETIGDSWTNENTLTYRNVFKKNHSITAVLGQSTSSNGSEQYGFSVQNIPNEALGEYGFDEGTPYAPVANGGRQTMLSFFGRINHSYQSRYISTFTFRADGSSKFVKKNRWGYFPSVAFAWNMKEENFLKKDPVISTSKLRVSYGASGNNRIGNYEPYTQVGLSSSYAYSFYNGTPVDGVTVSKIGNPDLKWETTDQYNIGYDFGVFKDRIAVTVDVYDKRTKNLLLFSDLPSHTGFTRVYKNIGSIQNRGLEFTLNTINVKSKEFEWNSNFNISFNRNKILSLAEGQESIISQQAIVSSTTPLWISRIGYPAGMFYGYIFDGIYQEEDFEVSGGKYVLKNDIPGNGKERNTILPGDIRYKDLNDDGTISNYDLTVIGNGQPLHTGGFTNNFSYKGFDLNIFLQWSYGNDIYNGNRMAFDGNAYGMNYTNQFASFEKRWTPENRSNEIYSVRGYGPQGYQSTRVLEDGSYLRIKTVSLSYTEIVSI